MKMNLTLKQLYQITKDEETCIRYLMDNEIIPKTKICYRCKRSMNLDIVKKRFRCDKKACPNTNNMLFKGTFFENCKFSISTCLEMMYLGLLNTPVDGIISATACSSHTVCDWMSFLRQMLAESTEETYNKIGGIGIEVEIDETKMGKRKYNRGHMVEGVWVIAGVERTPEKKVFAVSVPDRTAATIKEIIEKYVHTGSIILTDGWKAYKTVCKELSFDHLIVDHSKNFKDPITGVHTNTVEGVNNGLKTLIKPRNRTIDGIDNYLLYYIWRKNNKHNIWGGFIRALCTIKY